MKNNDWPPFVCEYCDTNFGDDVIELAKHIGKVHDMSHGENT